MKTVCPPAQCAGCMACQDICPHKAVTVQIDLAQCIPQIQPQLCVDCGLCRQVCQNHNPAPLQMPQQWLQGWAAEPSVREAGSSGGVAGALIRAFLEQGGAVCSCVWQDDSFCFRIAKSPEQAGMFAGSKYIKSNPAGAWAQVKALLKAGQKVLVIALPCQVAAAKLYVGSLAQQLYTVDLICHGSPAPAIFEQFLHQQGLHLDAPAFRKKQSFRLSDGARPISPAGVRDRYTLAFLNGLIYTENCYSCPYAREERPGDLTLGDAWGAQLPADQEARGVSLVLCQSEKGQQLLSMANLTLTPAHRETALANNHQLCHPSRQPEGWASFMAALKNGVPLGKLVAKALPRQSRRQDIKALLSRLGIRKS